MKFLLACKSSELTGVVNLLTTRMECILGVIRGDPHYVLKCSPSSLMPVIYLNCHPPSLMHVIKISSISVYLNSCQFRFMLSFGQEINGYGSVDQNGNCNKRRNPEALSPQTSTYIHDRSNNSEVTKSVGWRQICTFITHQCSSSSLRLFEVIS